MFSFFWLWIFDNHQPIFFLNILKTFEFQFFDYYYYLKKKMESSLEKDSSNVSTSDNYSHSGMFFYLIEMIFFIIQFRFFLLLLFIKIQQVKVMIVILNLKQLCVEFWITMKQYFIVWRFENYFIFIFVEKKNRFFFSNLFCFIFFHLCISIINLKMYF